ncbi:MAG: 4a-hydroxytetrahydrobiopterin dehydratase [Ilumatobacteraceae bacterium]
MSNHVGRLDGEVNSSQWHEVDGALRRDFEFADFAQAWAFMAAVAAAAEEMDHHPDWSNSWNKVAIALRSHDVGRVTDRDRRLAAAIDRIADGSTVLDS